MSIVEISRKISVFNALCDVAAVNGLRGLNSLSSPAELALLNNNAVYSWGQSGWLATPTSTLAADNLLNIARPVNMFTRDSSNRPLNILQVPLKATAGANAGRGMMIVGPN